MVSYFFCFRLEAGWQSGYAEDCKSLDAGSIPTPASTLIRRLLVKIKELLSYDARVVELVDTRDLKSLEGNFVPVRLRPRAPINY